MAIEVKRKPNERPENLVNRFSRRVLQTGVLKRAKDRHYRKKKISKAIRRKERIRQLKDREKKEYLIKIGLIKPIYRK